MIEVEERFIDLPLPKLGEMSVEAPRDSKQTPHVWSFHGVVQSFGDPIVPDPRLGSA